MKRIVKKYYLVFIIDFFILVSFFLIPTISHASPTIRPIYEVLGSSDKTGQQIRNIWQNILNAINLFVILVLIIVAFSQILRINVNTYGVKKVLPAILLAAIAANFSFLICRLMIDISNVFVDFFILGAGMTADEKAKADPNQIVGAFNVFSSQFDFEKAKAGGGGMLMWYIIGRGLVIAGAILILILAFLFFIRNWVIYFLIPLAPLAFMATILPQSKSLFNQWWSNFAKWVFMPVVSCFWLWVGGQWYANVGKEGGGSALLNFAFAVLCYYLALTTPFKLGGGVMSAWGNLGKKAISPLSDYAKRKGSLFWSNQAASENKANLLGHVARIPINMQDAKKYDEERIANNQQAALARTMKSRGGKKRTTGREKFGGDVDLAKAEILNEYLKTTEGMTWSEKKADFTSRLNVANTGKEAGLVGGTRRYRESGVGKENAENLLRFQKDKELQEAAINIADKQLVVSFNQGQGVFANKKDQQLVNDYFAAFTRNKTLDEAVSNSSNKKVEAILGDQMFLENIKDSLKQIPEEISKLKEDDDKLVELQASFRAGRISTGSEEHKLLLSLAASRTQRRDRKVELESLRGDMTRKAVDFARGKKHLDGFISNGEVVGFAGTIEGEQEFREAIGTTMMTRAGKLMSIEMKADAEKLLDARTPREIGEDLIHGKPGEFTEEQLIKFRKGRRFENSPEVNRRIEAHVLAVSRVARQNNNPYRDLTRTALVNMLDDNSAVSAGSLFNQLAEQSAISDRIDVSLPPDQIRLQIKGQMNKRNKNATIAFASVEDQNNVGLSDNPSSYLSGGGGFRRSDYSSAGQGHSEITDVEPQKFSSIVRTVAMSRGEYNPNLASNNDVLKHLDAITDTLKSERNTIINEIGRSSGINVSNDVFKRTLNDAIMRIPRGQIDSTSIASILNPILKQFGGKELDDRTQITIPSTTGQRTMDLGHAAGRTQAASLAVQSSELIKMQPRIQEIAPQITHFSQMEGGKSTVDEAIKTIESSLNGPDGIRSPKVSTEQVKKMVNDTLRKVGMGTEVDINFSSNDEAIDFLRRTLEAAISTSQAYDKDGKFDMTRAQSAAAKYYLAQQSK